MGCPSTERKHSLDIVVGSPHKFGKGWMKVFTRGGLKMSATICLLLVLHESDTSIRGKTDGYRVVQNLLLLFSSCCGSIHPEG